MTPKRCKAVFTQTKQVVAAVLADRRYLFRDVPLASSRNSPERINQRTNSQDRDADAGIFGETPKRANGETPAGKNEQSGRQRMSRDAYEVAFGLADRLGLRPKHEKRGAS